eukprot:4404759-Pyramimonas_sp.AAC.1
MTGTNGGMTEDDIDSVFGFRVDADGGGVSGTQRKSDDFDERPTVASISRCKISGSGNRDEVAHD